MTRDDIIRMALEAGGHASGFGDRWVMYTQDLERFASLVAAEKDKEIERLRGALKIIAGELPCIDNLMGNADIARTALQEQPR